MYMCLLRVLYLTEEVSLLLSLHEAGQVAADHQVRVIQHCIKPTPGGEQGLDTQDTMFKYGTTFVANITDLKMITTVCTMVFCKQM